MCEVSNMASSKEASLHVSNGHISDTPFWLTVCCLLVWLNPLSVQGCGPAFQRYCTCPGACCMPTLGGGFYSDRPIPNALQSVLGGNIRLDGKLREGKQRTGVALAPGNLTKKQVSLAEDLTCATWDHTCLWRNANGGALDWYRGSGTPDMIRFKVATGSSTPPRPPFAIAATSQALSSSESALLISDPVACQAGDGEVRFTYWTSPHVRLSACWRKANSDSYSFCSEAIAGGGPGPAVIRIPGPIMNPFELVINADNFVYNDGKYTGGFAMIDDLKYNAQICSKAEPEDIHFMGQRKSSLLGSAETLDPFESIRIIPAPADDTEACRLVDCNFSDGACVNYISKSDFSIHEGPVGNPITGIPGDGSLDPFNATGEFAYALGPKDAARFTLPPFTLHEARVMRFGYYRAATKSKLRVLAQRSKEREVIIFEAPDTDIYSRRWIQEAIPLKSGRYEQIIFEALNLEKNAFIGIDEIKLMDVMDHLVCG